MMTMMMMTMMMMILSMMMMMMRTMKMKMGRKGINAAKKVEIRLVKVEKVEAARVAKEEKAKTRTRDVKVLSHKKEQRVTTTREEDLHIHHIQTKEASKLPLYIH